MTRTRDLDFTPLTRRTGFTARLRAAIATPRMVIAGTVGMLLIVVPTAVLAGQFATGNASDVGGLVLLAMLLAGGVYVMADILMQSGGTSALRDFAGANDLVLVDSTLAPQYRGSLFADESHAVGQSVRTQGEPFVEVGDRFPTAVPAGSSRPNRPQLFLRSRLSGRAVGDPGEIVTPELHDRLSRLAGGYTLELSHDELTVFGDDGLDVERPGRVQEAFSLVDELTARANATLVVAPLAGVQAEGHPPTAAGFTIPAESRPEPPRRRRSPFAIAALTLALLIGLPVGFAIVMSILDDHLQGESTARLGVGLFVLGAFAVVGWFVKAMTTGRAERGRPRE